jgi:hypothetical protein
VRSKEEKIVCVLDCTRIVTRLQASSKSNLTNMRTWYYDNGYQSYKANPQFVEFERVYCLNFNIFTEENWKELGGIYDNLPSTRYDKNVPFWFGTDENNPPYLYVSVEPSGLQVVGVLPPDDWLKWNESFRKQVETSSLPTYET